MAPTRIAVLCTWWCRHSDPVPGRAKIVDSIFIGCFSSTAHHRSGPRLPGMKQRSELPGIVRPPGSLSHAARIGLPDVHTMPLELAWREVPRSLEQTLIVEPADARCARCLARFIRVRLTLVSAPTRASTVRLAEELTQQQNAQGPVSYNTSPISEAAGGQAPDSEHPRPPQRP